MGINRRTFLVNTGRVLGGLGVVSLAGLLAQSGEAKSYIRPPGSLSEEEFLNRCIRCFKCGEICPYYAIKFVGTHDGKSMDTPMLIPRENACQLCMKCGEICPTQALEKIERDKKVISQKVKMGVPRLNKATCLSWNNRSCGICYMNCPYQNEAITVLPGERPVIHPEKCVGCGICEMVCLTNPASIWIEPLDDPASKGGV